VNHNNSSNFAFQNLENASQILTSAGVTQPISVRVLFDSANPREKMVWAEISKFSNQIGFNLVDASVTDPLAHITAGDYDVSITQQPLFSLSNFASVESVVTDKFESTSFDDLAKKLATANKPSKQQALAAQLDSALFAQGYGLPLYQVPTFTA
jgi:peptide/nickel transport system substrate-binding protein